MLPLLWSYIFLAAQEATSLNVVIAGLAFLNTLGIFGLIYHVGQYVGKNDQQWRTAEKRLAELDTALALIRSQELNQVKTEVALSALKTIIETEMKSEIQLLRHRSHELANIMLRLTLGEKPQRPEWPKD